MDSLPIILLLILGVPSALALLGVLLFGRTRVVLIVGIVLWLGLTILSFTNECPAEASECYPELGAVAALIGLFGWAGGAAAGRLLRSRRGQTKGVG